MVLFADTKPPKALISSLTNTRAKCCEGLYIFGPLVGLLASFFCISRLRKGELVGKKLDSRVPLAAQAHRGSSVSG